MRTNSMGWHLRIKILFLLAFCVALGSTVPLLSTSTDPSVTQGRIVCPTSSGLFPCANASVCIEIGQLCDNITHCSDNSDEGGQCADKSQCSKTNCTRHCVPTPSGPVCICNRGWKFGNGTCSDVNECNEYGICDQRCRNLEGSYECFCDGGFELQADKRTCKATGNAAVLVFKDVESVYTYNLREGVTSKIATVPGFMKGIDFDGTFIYWSNHTDHDKTVHRFGGSLPEPQRIISAGYKVLPVDIAVDWITGNIYFSDSKAYIGVCNSNGQSCSVIMEPIQPKYISLNPYKRTMYWVEGKGRDERIMTAGMDGANLRFVAKIGVDGQTPLTFDFQNNRVYWKNWRDVESINLDGSQHRIVLPFVPGRLPQGIAVFEGKLYWSRNNDIEGTEFHSCNKFSCDNETIVGYVMGTLYVDQIRISRPPAHQNVSNPCKTSRCTDMCLLATNNLGYTCACREGSALSNDMVTCQPVNDTDILFVGAGQTLIRVELRNFENFTFSHIPLGSLGEIGPITYDSLNDKVILYDTVKKSIYSYEPTNNRLDVIVDKEIGNITDMDCDSLAQKLYWIDSEKRTVEVLSLESLERTSLRQDLHDDPVSVVFVPFQNSLFVAFYREGFRIERLPVDGARNGSNDTSFIQISNSQGPPFSLAYDPYQEKILWTDFRKIGIAFLEFESDEYLSLEKPAKSIAVRGKYIFWVQRESNYIRWIEMSELRRVFLAKKSKEFDIGIRRDIKHPHIVAVRQKKKVYEYQQTATSTTKAVQ